MKNINNSSSAVILSRSEVRRPDHDQEYCELAFKVITDEDTFLVYHEDIKNDVQEYSVYVVDHVPSSRWRKSYSTQIHLFDFKNPEHLPVLLLGFLTKHQDQPLLTETLYDLADSLRDMLDAFYEDPTERTDISDIVDRSYEALDNYKKIKAL